jgi:hypothetical protein
LTVLDINAISKIEDIVYSDDTFSSGFSEFMTNSDKNNSIKEETLNHGNIVDLLASVLPLNLSEEDITLKRDLYSRHDGFSYVRKNLD